MKIPTHWKEQHALPISANSAVPSASDFMFIVGRGHGPCQTEPIPLSPEDEGRMLFFPAWLKHQVYPFYECEEERITISGNIVYNLNFIIAPDNTDRLYKEKEYALKMMESNVEVIKKEMELMKKTDGKDSKS